MIPGVVAVLWYASKHPGETKEPAYKNNSSIGFGGGTLISLVLLNEFVMGWTFIDASGSSAFTGNSLSNILGALSYVSGSDWFLFTLSFEILFTIYMLHDFFSKDFIKIACLQSLITFFVPTAIGSRLWSTVSIIADIVILSGLLILLSMNSQTGSHSVKNYLRLLIILDSLVVAGSLIWVVEGNALLLLPLLIAEVVLYFNAILERVNMGKDRSATSLVPELSGTGSL